MSVDGGGNRSYHNTYEKVCLMPGNLARIFKRDAAV